MAHKRSPFIEKYFDNIYPEPNCGCWLWGGYANQQGYGIIFVNRTPVLVHRWSYEYHNKTTIPHGMLACHKCNMPSCSNPAHIYIGTQKQNMRQSYNEGRVGTNLYEEKKIYQYTKSGLLINTFHSMMYAEKITGVAQPNISACCNKRNKSAGGYIFAFIPISTIDETEMVRGRKTETQTVS